MSYQTIISDVRPPIAELVLNRPKAGNTLTAELLAELADATTQLATERDVRAVVLRGCGPHFCFGASVDMFCDEPPDQRPALIRDLVTKLHLAITRLTRLEVPVLGVGHGEAHAWGLVNWLVADEEVEARTKELAGSLAAGPTLALGRCKRLMFDGFTDSFDTHLENEAVALVRSFATADSDEGFRAFREHRAPRFRAE